MGRGRNSVRRAVAAIASGKRTHQRQRHGSRRSFAAGCAVELQRSRKGCTAAGLALDNWGGTPGFSQLFSRDEAGQTEAGQTEAGQQATVVATRGYPQCSVGAHGITRRGPWLTSRVHWAPGLRRCVLSEVFPAHSRRAQLTQ